MFGINLPSLPWKWIGIALAALAVVSAVAFSIKAYGNARYELGVTDTDKKWQEAAAVLERQSKEAATSADKAAGQREADYAKRLEEEKEKLDEAVRSGDSPFDVLFGVRD